jgi:hypothetical protein
MCGNSAEDSNAIKDVAEASIIRFVFNKNV